ncbi:hypothetical protein QTI24_24575 [Variovorax sp. J22P240]|uniref:hypothetical protein n=1 Tax=Variovorax sp. J22P240 TaxID=3053514 RepID=UPI00257762E9|nr:hypothetical protein [Variovorax sp. J22P240]MDM0001806.1 hypothetical protein [Variovorax sp. J22P240]
MTTISSPLSLGMPLVSEQAIRNVNFFNGRLVTSADMARTQVAQHEADERLGQGIGAGIVQGLEVEVDNALQRRLTIKRGLAISHAGQTLCLNAQQVLALVPPADPVVPPTTGGFARCQPLSGGYVAGDGLYLLTLAPVTVALGKAPVLALEPGNVRCNTDAMVEAVQFRLLRVDPASSSNSLAAAAVSKWRSAVAYNCLGFPGLAKAHGRMGIPAEPGLLDAVGLSDCEVPLALVYLAATPGVVFVDCWSVRRRVASQPASPPWSAWLGEQLDALGEAQLAQFQEQLLEIPTASLPGLRAADWFSWLPPAGFLDATGARQIDWATFLDTRKPARTVALAAGDVRALLSQALRRDPVDLAATAPTPRFRVYRVGGDGPWLFVREAPNAPHAEEVWLDGARARLPGIEDVQSAIDALRGRTCGELVLWPGIDAQARINALPANSDLRLCFESGDYPLVQPLRVHGFRHVVIHGGGGGSQLHCDTAEAALLIEQCTSVKVSDLTLHTGRVGPGKQELGSGLLGALTVIGVPQVHIERVAARCGGGSALGAGGIVVRQIDTPGTVEVPSRVGIADCEVLVGEAQLGILCVDCALTDLRHNRIVAVKADRPPERGIVVAGRLATDVHVEHNFVDSAAQGISLGLSGKEDRQPLQIQRAVISHNTVRVSLGPRDRNRNRFGIFVGNAVSLLLEGNRVAAEGALASTTAMEAIRLTGVYGLHLALRVNHMRGTSIGISFQPLPPLPARDTCVWVFDANLDEAGEVIHCQPNVRELLRGNDNVGV